MALMKLRHVTREEKGGGKKRPKLHDPEGRCLATLREIFNEIDADGGGTISTPELCHYVRTKVKKLTIAGNLQEQMLLCRELDEDGDGEVDIDEFLHGMMTCSNKGLRKHIFDAAYPEQLFRKEFALHDGSKSDQVVRALATRVTELERELERWVSLGAPLRAQHEELEGAIAALENALAAKRKAVASIENEAQANRDARRATRAAERDETEFEEAELRTALRLKDSEIVALERHLAALRAELDAAEEEDLLPQLEAAANAGDAMMKVNAARLILLYVKKRKHRFLRKRARDLHAERAALLEAEAAKRKREITAALKRDHDNFDRIEDRLAHARAMLVETTRGAAQATAQRRAARAEFERERNRRGRTEKAIDGLCSEVRTLQVRMRTRKARLVVLRGDFQQRVTSQISSISHQLKKAAGRRHLVISSSHEESLRAAVEAQLATNAAMKEELAELAQRRRRRESGRRRKQHA